MEQSVTSTSISIKGQQVTARSAFVLGQEIISTGRWLRIAQVKDEDYAPGPPIRDLPLAARELAESGLKADLLTTIPFFWEAEPQQGGLYFEWDSVAAIPLSNYSTWLAELSQESRRNIRLAEKRGVSVRVLPYDTEFARGIKGIYDETPIRQGRKFWHFGKDLASVERENGTYANQSDFIGAYFEGEMIGFIKMVYVHGSARIMQILSRNGCFDKRPANALIAKAVESACSKNARFLTYCKYTYGKNGDTSIAEFKRRNGFKEYRFPRYYVPLNLKGSAALQLRLHAGMKSLIPLWLHSALMNCRSRYYRATRPEVPAKSLPSAMSESVSRRQTP